MSPSRSRRPARVTRPIVAAAVLASVLAAAACARRAPMPAGGPVPGETTAPAGAGRGGAGRAPALPAAFAWSPGAHRVVVESEATVEREGDPARETVRSRAVVQASLATGATGSARTITGQVDSLVVQAGARVTGDTAAARGEVPPTVTTGVRFRGVADARAVRLDPESGVEVRCTSPAGGAALAALAAARDGFPRIVGTLAAGARWRDTTVTASCAGPALVVVQTEWRYEVTGAEGDGTVRVVRRGTSTLRGTGAAGVRPVQVTGTGSASWRYAVDPVRGAVVSGDGESRSAITVSIGGTAERFAQTVRTTLAAGR